MDAPTLRGLAVKVSQYFRDFLDSDFKRQQAPRRRIILQSESGFRSGMRIAPYPSLLADIWKLISQPSGSEAVLDIAPHKYSRPISPVLKKIIEEQIAVISDTAFASVRLAVVEKAQTTLSGAISDPEEWVDKIRTTLAAEVGSQVIRPLIALLDGPLRGQAYSVIDSIYAAEGELIARVGAEIDGKLPDVLAKYLADQNHMHVVDAVEAYLTKEAGQAALMAYFETFIAADAFLEFRDLDTYCTTGDGLQMYLYIGRLKYRNNEYPLFFLPIEVERKKNSATYQVKIINHLFANRKAMDFALQEISAGLSREWVSPIKERITYITPEQSIYEVAKGLFRNVAIAFDLGGKVELSSQSTEQSTASVSLSSAMYFAAYERADEALLNDYEEIIDQANRGEAGVVSLFESLIKGTIMENPVSISAAVEAEWDGLPLVDRVVHDGAIPLNEEQLKVLAATRHPEGRIIVVEGPPGTGKSHTLAAIAADCIQRGKSCLILSDKKEALDVVQNKLGDAMSRVRHEKDFPNPILRLGQQNANFKQLTSNSTVSQVTNYAKAMKSNQPRMQAEQTQVKADLQQCIAMSLETLGSITMGELQAMHEDEAKLKLLAPNLLALLEECTDPSLLPELKAIDAGLETTQQYLTEQFNEGDFTPDTLWMRVRRDKAIHQFALNRDTQCFRHFETLNANQLRELSAIIVNYRQLKMPLFGYLFRGSQVASLDRSINALPATMPLFLKTHADALQNLIGQANTLRMTLEAEGLIELFPEVFGMFSRGKMPSEGAWAAYQSVALMRKASPRALAGMLVTDKDDSRLWPLALRFLRRWIAIRSSFSQAPEYDYVGTKSKLERLNTSSLNASADARLVSFMENHRADAKALSAVIANRQKFPEDKFDSVKESFPVIIAGIREFGEFMPLAPDLFDVVIIDEGSQVSVAQALPALLRAKKVVIFGDSKQFSNVKSANASIATNDKYRADLVAHFERNVSREASVLQRLSMFDVKRSILEFCSLGANYSIMLRKHFRSYGELIGYSSSNFYNHQLQAIKIRSVALEDVVRFDQVDVAEGMATRATNKIECEFILEKLLELLEEENPPTVGIITPFREQQTLLTKRLFGHASGQDFEERLRLKIMTFDSCQGEERNIIFYSMVATAEHDALQYIFPVDMLNAAESVEDKLKIQRLNVGFSRAQEMVWFVHSKPVDQFRGSIAKALNYYQSVTQRQELSADMTDQNSPMEAKVLDWLQKTAFYQEHESQIEILPQFPIGDYLRQLDPTYQHPAWRVDFLLTYQGMNGSVKIVVEYDGLEHHFERGREINVGNHQRYMVEADIERQLTLESYGYRFLRVNRFNLGVDPVQTLSMRLARLVQVAGEEPVSASVQKIQDEAAGLASKELKTCPTCGEHKKADAFFDPALKGGTGGVGRICLVCKTPEKVTQPKRARPKRRWSRY